MKRILLSFLLVAWSAPSALAEESYGKEFGLLGPVTFGPKLTIAVPLPIKVGLEAKYLNVVGLSADYGLLPTIPYDNMKFGTEGWSLAARYFVFRQAFFIGVAFGTQDVEFSLTEFTAGESITGTATYTQTFIAPHIGWRWTWESGMFFGMELGAQIPLSYTREVSTDHPELEALPAVALLKSRVYDRIDQYGNTPLPFFSLFQFGWYF